MMKKLRCFIVCFCLVMPFVSFECNADEYFDNTYWAPDSYGTWDAGDSEWDAEEFPVPGGGVWMVRLNPINSWEVDYRPQFIIVEHNKIYGTREIYIGDSEDSEISYDGTRYISGEKVAIQFEGYDIDELLFTSSGEFSITNIEFEYFNRIIGGGSAVIIGGGSIVLAGIPPIADPIADDLVIGTGLIGFGLIGINP